MMHRLIWLITLIPPILFAPVSWSETKTISQLKDPLEAWETKIQLPIPKIETLRNGLVVAWFPNDSLPVIDLALLIKSGYRDDPKGHSGAAHLLSQIIDKGAGSDSFEVFSKKVEQLGASHYVSADEESFTLGMHGLSEDRETLLTLLGAMTQKPILPIQQFKKEKERTLDRWSHLSDSSDSLISVAFYRWMYSGTPYGRGSFKNKKALEALQYASVVNYHKNYFRPDNAILMVVGDVDQKKFKSKILSVFSEWGKVDHQTIPSPADSQSEKKNKKVRIEYHHPYLKLKKNQDAIFIQRDQLSQSKVYFGWEAPIYTDPDHYALVVANALFGEYFNSRLNSRLRDELGITYSIGSALSYQKENGVFAVTASTQSKNTGKLIREVQKLAKVWIEGPVSEQELRDAKNYLLGQFPVRMSTLYSVASRWLGGYIFGLGPSYLNAFIPNVRKVTSKQVQSALKKHFENKKFRIVIVGDLKEVKPSLKKHGLNQLKIISAEKLL